MADVFSKEKRSWVMSRIRGKGTKMERLLESKLIKNKIYFKKYPKIYGKPDFVVNKNIIIFIDGCFWHKCPKHYKEPLTKKNFWAQKIENNVKRDRKVTKLLKKEGYHIIRFWEHELEKNPEKCINKIVNKFTS